MLWSEKAYSHAIKPYVTDIRTDIIGNIIAHKSGNGKRIMLIAHHDVVRLMVTYIDGNGFLYVKPAGGIDVSLLLARRVEIRHGETIITGIIGKKPIHLMRGEPNAKIAYEDLWIDIGATCQSEAQNMVSIGDYAYFCSDFEELPNDFVTGAYLDNQVGLRVLMKLAEQLALTELPRDVFFVASNHEEIGMRGASVAAHAVQPEVCICIDVTI